MPNPSLKPSANGRPPPSKAAYWAIGLGIFSILLLCGIAFSLFDVWRAFRAATWPTTNGLVVESRSAPDCGRRKGTGHHLIVSYTYKVGGVTFKNRRLLFGAASCYSGEEAKASTAQFPVGAVVKVGFDPQAPAEAVLIAGRVDESTWTGIYFMSFWFLLVAMATGMAVSVARSERRRDPKLPLQRTLGKRR